MKKVMKVTKKMYVEPKESKKHMKMEKEGSKKDMKGEMKMMKSKKCPLCGK